MSLSGNLEKWTNYWLGWQSRYFKLENGILSYYQNEEEVDSGAKASLKVSSCDIVPDIVDNRKFDVTVGSGKLMICSSLNIQSEFRSAFLITSIEYLTKTNLADCPWICQTRK